MDATIVVDGLSKKFPTVTAVDTLTFDVARGELFGLVGPDGAGKTTSLRMLAGILRPTSGDARIAGRSVTQDPERVKPHLAYMAQRFGLYGDLTVRENLDFYADLYRVPHQARPARLERLYRFSNLGPFSDRLAANLSGGMKQKLSLSCALIHQPTVMLLDEPTFGVDPISRRDLWLIVHQMVEEGVTVLVSTAYLDEAERCDRVAMMNQGRIIALDRPDALQARLVGRIVAVTADRPRDARDALRGLPMVQHASLFGETVHVVMDDATVTWPQARRQLEETGIRVTDAQVVSPSLEDVFIHLVQRDDN